MSPPGGPQHACERGGAALAPRGAAAPHDGRPSPALFREILKQLHEAHQREVAHLEETISGLTRGRGAAGECLEAEAQLGSLRQSGPAGAGRADSDSAQVECGGSASGELDVGCDSVNLAVAPPPTRHSFVSAGTQPSLQTCAEGGEDRDAAQATEPSKDNDPSKDQELGALGRGQYVWQWQRSKGGFRNYPSAQSARIEEAYRRGLSKVRLKSGTDGQIPMEIFFVDMIQLDPKSRNLRKVRRVGAGSWYIELARHVQAFARSVYLGEPRWESLEKYKKRQRGILGTDQGGDPTTSASSRDMVNGGHISRGTSYMAKADNVCARIVDTTAFFTISTLVMVLNIVWIGISVELGDFSQSLWDRHTSSVVLEYAFMLYFIAELIVQLASMRYFSQFYRYSWLIIDALCTSTMVLEVLVIPNTAISADSVPALQVLRLTKLARLLKLFQEFKDVMTIMRGMMCGMRSAGLIWILIAVLLYTCSVLLTTSTGDHNDVLREKYFGSMGQTMITLLVHGLALDGCGVFFHDLRMHNGLLQGLIFSAFVFLAYFGLLNMLVGAFCNVAIEVAAVEKDSGELEYIQDHLEDIVECYMEDGKDRINCDKFHLVMKNADVLQTLRACGTDLDGLMTLSEVLFPHVDSEISFPEFSSVIVRLRKGKPASVSEVIRLQEFTKQRMDKLEELIRVGMRIEVENTTSKHGSVLDFPRLRSKISHQDEEIHPEQRGTPRTDTQKVRKNRS